MSDLTERETDNFVYYLGKIAKHKYPNIKRWQESIVTNAERGLADTFTYEKAREYYHTKIKGKEQ